MVIICPALTVFSFLVILKITENRRLLRHRLRRAITCWRSFQASFLAAALLLILFRLFDILKPHPISYVDKRFKSGFGIVLDDLLAGVFAGLTLLGGNFFIDFF